MDNVEKAAAMEYFKTGIRDNLDKVDEDTLSFIYSVMMRNVKKQARPKREKLDQE